MWLQFVILLGLFLLILVIPGFCFFRLLKAHRLEALLLSPVFSVSLYSVLGILYGLLGVPSSVVSVFAIPLALLLVISAVKFAKGRACPAASEKSCESAIPSRGSLDARMAVFYLACGIIAGTVPIPSSQRMITCTTTTLFVPWWKAATGRRWTHRVIWRFPAL